MLKKPSKTRKPARFKEDELVGSWLILEVIQYDPVIKHRGGWLYLVECSVCGEKYNYYQKNILQHVSQKSKGCSVCKGKPQPKPLLRAVTDLAIISTWSSPQFIGQDYLSKGQDGIAI